MPGGHAGPPASPRDQDRLPPGQGPSLGGPGAGGAGAGGAGRGVRARAHREAEPGGGVHGRLGRLHPKGSVAAPAPPQAAQSYCSPFNHCGFDSCP